MDQIAPPFPEEYDIEVCPLEGTVEARHGDIVLASSSAARVMYETRLPPAVYFPRGDVTVDLQEAPEHRTFCPFKGTATYWDLEVAGETIVNGAWSYQKALPEAEDIEGYIGFMPSALTSLECKGPKIAPREDGNISGPLIDWLMRGAWQCGSPEELTRALGQRLNAQGVVVSRIGILIWSLHPLIVGKNYTWERATGEVVSRTPSYDLLENPVYTNSPFRHVANGLGGVRQNLTVEDAEFKFPIIDELRAEGATDYVAMPLPFSDGRYNVMTLACDHPAGFTTANLGLVFECATVISRFYEVFTLKENASALLGTYLGKRTGARVLGGEIRRGDGDEIDAAVLMCDLRHSSKWEGELERPVYLDLLNRFFELTTDIVNAHDGEVLKLIGDAILAIFPAGGDASTACCQAVASAREIAETIGDVPIAETGQVADCAIGVAFGNVTYGNVGSGERLDFTVIGSAANIAARLGDLGKQLGHQVVTTREVAAATPDGLVSVGAYELRNVTGKTEAFAPTGGEGEPSGAGAG
ncbi:MAG: DUF427 domain-containing protein [Pseudomonadota bacterium]